MNGTINKMFYACSLESLFLRYKKISKKVVKLGSFLQYIYFWDMMAASEKLI